MTLTKATLGLSGLIALAVSIGVLFLPHEFHATAGIQLGTDVNLLNEMRASGGMLLISALFILVGAFRAQLTDLALIVSATLYLSYGLSRLVSLVADGMPGAGLLQILVLELAIGGLCAVLLVTSPASRRNATRIAQA
ncbi:DUF4345 domain-containing protein [Pseudophaeobacter sp.]|uniref:DUF4345 domain-containing protein n=1 Tax=Pseudophaeobacter sp. TaxID=1971739 RepID=UPI003298AD4B